MNVPFRREFLPTVGAIAERLGVPVHRVEYLIRSRRIEPAARAGNSRVFAESDVARIADELAVPSHVAHPLTKGGPIRD